VLQEFVTPWCHGEESHVRLDDALAVDTEALARAEGKRTLIRVTKLDLAEPGIPHKAGHGRDGGNIMAAPGDRPAAQITRP
jgi:hypothetical protein